MADDDTNAAVCQQQETTEDGSVQQQQKQDSSALREEQQQSVEQPVEMQPEREETGRNEPQEAREQPEQDIQRTGSNSIPQSVERNGRGNRMMEQNNNQQIQQQQQQQHLLLGVRDRLFHALFYRVAMAYARAVPQHCRVILEFFALFKVKCGISCSFLK